MLVPARPLQTFVVNVFTNRFQPKGLGSVQSWQECIELHEKMLTQSYHKDKTPTICCSLAKDLTRTKDTVTEQTALFIDVDDGPEDFQTLWEAHKELKGQGLSHIMQWRKVGNKYKAHFVLPLGLPCPVADAAECTQINIELMRQLVPRLKFDAAVARPTALLAFMTKRPEYEDPEMVAYTADGLDYFALVGDTTEREQKPTKPQRAMTQEDASEATKFLAEALRGAWDGSKPGWLIKCPAKHRGGGATKTLLFPNGHIVCMSDDCAGKPHSHFIQLLSQEQQDKYLEYTVAPVVQALEQQVANTVSVSQANDKIQQLLGDTRVSERHATVIRVSTGAGKSYATAKYLNKYSAPFDDEGPTSGRKAIMAVPTNKLLREVDQRFEIPRVVRTGVLAVLDSDGKQACQQYDYAKKVQDSGGNVSRLVCPSCPLLDACSARQGVSVGKGALTNTNHAILPGAAKAVHNRGRDILTVWDESPPWVGQVTLSREAIGEFLELALEERRRAYRFKQTVTMTDVYTGVLLAERAQVAMEPVLAFLRWLEHYTPAYTENMEEQRIPVSDLVDRWYRHVGNELMLKLAPKIEGTEPRPRLRACLQLAHKLNPLTTPLVDMTKKDQEAVLKLEKFFQGLAICFGEKASITKTKDAMTVSAITEHGVLLRDYGGVVLDATANLAEIQALRSDAVVTDLRVEDANKSERYIMFTDKLSRYALAKDANNIKQHVAHARQIVRLWALKQDIAWPKVAVFSYMFAQDAIKEVWPEAEVAYFGNTRGYDHYFQEGYDCFITFGDPISNIGALRLSYATLKGGWDAVDEEGLKAYIASTAAAECSQAHGRARDPQPKKGPGGLLHMHYGRIAPAGWDATNTRLERMPAEIEEGEE